VHDHRFGAETGQIRPEMHRADDHADVARFVALTGPEGRSLMEALAAERVTDETALRLSERLRARYPAALVADGLTLARLRERGRAKFSRAQDMMLTRDGLEQASGETVAGHRAARLATGGPVADLCCGIGGDLVALAAHGPVMGVDRDPLHAWMAGHNADVYGVGERVRTEVADVRAVDLAGVAAVFVDPARRSERGRMRDGEPPLAWCVGLAERVPRVAVKAAPGLDRAVVPAGWEAEFVAVGTNLKETVLWSPAAAEAATRATLLVAAARHTLLPAPGDDVAVGEPGEYLLDPNPAVTRAGLVAELARSVGAWKIDERIAFLAAAGPVVTPFARTLRVLDSGPWREKELVARLRALDVGTVDVRRRGLAGDVDVLRRRLARGITGGTRRATLVMTRARDRPWALVCVDPDG
jgi:THUMP domain-containing protein/RNA cap guanine-N2 methyltransferase